VVELVGPARIAGYRPLFQVMLTLRTTPASWTCPGVHAEPMPVGPPTVKFDLAFQLVEMSDGVLQYRTDLYDPATAEALAEQFLRLLEAAVAESDRRIDSTDILTAAERHQVLGGFAEPTTGSVQLM
jgi:non-ribosomal peptide synthetase component F